MYFFCFTSTVQNPKDRKTQKKKIAIRSPRHKNVVIRIIKESKRSQVSINSTMVIASMYPQDASHHRDSYIFSKESLYMNLYFPLLLGERQFQLIARKKCWTLCDTWDGRCLTADRPEPPMYCRRPKRVLHGSALVQSRSSGHLAFATGHNLQRNPTEKLQSYVAPEFILECCMYLVGVGAWMRTWKTPIFGSLLLGSSPGRSKQRATVGSPSC